MRRIFKKMLTSVTFTIHNQPRYYCYKPVSRSPTYKQVKRPDFVDEEVPLGKKLEAKILANGPITVADYMKEVLTAPSAGYYMNKDVFGQQGDFITSPEISQMFGEMVAVWMLNELYKIGNPRPLQLIELGPGRGSLMEDILRVFKHFKQTDDLRVHLVEISPYLSSLQAQNLCANSDIHSGASPLGVRDSRATFYQSGVTQDGVQVYWYNKVQDVPDAFSIVLAHEFFDALPIHKFQLTEAGWKEVLITCTRDKDDESLKFSYVLSPGQTAVGQIFVKKTERREHVEVCPDAGVLTEHVSLRLEQHGGFSLFVDYGHDGDKTDTFRAFKKHKLHDPLVAPGTADLTADVDFSFLREAARDRVVTYGPVSQGLFLKRLGIETRLKNLLSVVTSEEDKVRIQSGYDMIVNEDQMGSRFQCFSMFPVVLKQHLTKFPVAGFSDSISK